MVLKERRCETYMIYKHKTEDLEYQFIHSVKKSIKRVQFNFLIKREAEEWEKERERVEEEEGTQWSNIKI